MSRLARISAGVAFALASFSQPLALDACAVSCEAARAAQAPAVAAPCHHTTSCASQISQPASPGSTAVAQVLAPPIVAAAISPPATSVAVWSAPDVLTSTGPPVRTQLRL
jgi:hypothetical protein